MTLDEQRFKSRKEFEQFEQIFSAIMLGIKPDDVRSILKSKDFNEELLAEPDLQNLVVDVVQNSLKHVDSQMRVDPESPISTTLGDLGETLSKQMEPRLLEMYTRIFTRAIKMSVETVLKPYFKSFIAELKNLIGRKDENGDDKMKEIEIIKGKHLEVSKVDWDEIETDDDFILPPLPQKRGKEIEIIKGGHTGICKVDWDRIE